MPDVDLRLDWDESDAPRVQDGSGKAPIENWGQAPISDQAGENSSPDNSGQAPISDQVGENSCAHNSGQAPISDQVGENSCLSPISGDDGFQWAHERDRAIEAALDTLGEEPLSVVGRQLRDIRRALALGTIKDATPLIDEVERFVSARIASLQSSAPIDHAGMREAREAMREALGLYAEACTVLRLAASAAGGQDLAAAADLSRRLEEEAAAALLRARDLLVSSRPEQVTEESL